MKKDIWKTSPFVKAWKKKLARKSVNKLTK